MSHHEHLIKESAITSFRSSLDAIGFFSIDSSPDGLSSNLEVRKQFLISFNTEMLRSPDATLLELSVGS